MHADLRSWSQSASTKAARLRAGYMGDDDGFGCAATGGETLKPETLSRRRGERRGSSFHPTTATSQPVISRSIAEQPQGKSELNAASRSCWDSA
jgi:hypothetical protein